MVEGEWATQKSGGAVAFASVQRKKGKQILSDTCKKRGRAACKRFLQPMGYHFLSFQGTERAEEGIEEMGQNDVVIRKTLLRSCGNGNVFDMSRRKRCKKVLELSPGRGCYSR